jgi:hypothetical protein
MTNSEGILQKVNTKIKKETQLLKIAWKAMTAMLKPLLGWFTQVRLGGVKTVITVVKCLRHPTVRDTWMPITIQAAGTTKS